MLARDAPKIAGWIIYLFVVAEICRYGVEVGRNIARRKIKEACHWTITENASDKTSCKPCSPMSLFLTRQAGTRTIASFPISFTKGHSSSMLF
jgi:hypothetical protein